ncbi:site-specific DNA-methyltransferase (adenine-specific) [Pedobacter cryoconitis]|uniref:site-specific DNA-methyltransferase (adenine-specific) n=1 Tax=Pedobacter cryoconitis TaxID=188932 RepID=A0A7W8ZNT1_9SPHI|nr:site-specific DNA-methyltransferase [Pedobacter cryoconitis]MBB5637273.1 site-specific DNA-methyltransferase (adenine-specific) [Pedobacter cryoconitis]
MKSLYAILDIDRKDKKKIDELAKQIDSSTKALNYYNDNHLIPSTKELDKIGEIHNLNPYQIMIEMGIYSQSLKALLSQKGYEISKLLGIQQNIKKKNHKITYETELGKLYQGDCISLMNTIEDSTVDLVFADPPFNLNKLYPSMMDDNISKQDYIKWTESWIDECIRILKPGGSLYIWNLPKWNVYFSEYLSHRLTFRNWISVDMKFSLPISGKLYPSHYSLLYFVKGEKPNSFKPDRMAMETCPHCYKELKDYGGYKSKMNPKGINMGDVWYDIPPVRHSKYKKRVDANELSIKLMDRIIEMSTEEGDLVFDPFGGSGTTYSIAEIKKRKWLGIELGPTDIIIDRLENKIDDQVHLEKVREKYNSLFPEKIKNERIKKGLWTDDSFLCHT